LPDKELGPAMIDLLTRRIDLIIGPGTLVLADWV